VLLPGQLAAVTVFFTSSAVDPAGLEILGFLRLRTLFGFALERVPLRGISGPFLQLLTPRLDFGCCAVGSHAEAVLCLKNLSQTSACEVSLVCELKFPGNQAANAIDTDGVKTAEWSSDKEKKRAG